MSSSNNHTITFARLAKFIGFAIVLCCIIAFLSSLFAPSFEDSSRGAVRGISAEENNSIQVLALGTSTVRRAISPDSMFERHGLRVFDSCSDSQPAIASYYLLKRALQTQGDSLSVVLLDAGPITNNNKMITSSKASERITGTMDLSPVKIEFAWDMTNEYDDVVFIEQIVRLLRYHSRWDKLSQDDLYKVFANDYQYAHGQPVNNFSYESNITRNQSGKYTSEKTDKITAEVDQDKDEAMALWNDASIRYIAKIAALCEENNLNLLLVKTPQSNWGDLKHDSTVLAAEQLGIDFYDLNLSDTWSQLNISYDADYYDMKHANLRGSVKISDFLGKLLVERYGLEDLRPDKRYDFMNTDIEKYNTSLSDMQLASCSNLNEYLDLIDNDRYAVFVTVKKDAAKKLDSNTRKKLKSIGFKGLAALEKNESYAGVVERGELVAEVNAKDGSKVNLSNDGLTTEIRDSFKMKSVGSDENGSASISIDDEKYAENGDGLNFVVYSLENRCVIDSACFNTHAGPERTSDLPNPAE